MTDVCAGIDIGGTFTKYGIVDRKGKVWFQGKITMAEYEEFDEFVFSLTQAIKQAYENIKSETKLIGIGIGAASGNHFSGCIEQAVNLKWKINLPIVKKLEENFHLPCILTNDANAAALGEKIYGHAKNMNDFIVITLGTGLGSGLISNGKLIHGKHGIAGELGHMSVKSAGRYCNCGKRGCLETYVSATGIKRTIYKLLADYLVDSELRHVSFNELDTRMITQAADRKDPVALAAFEYTGKILGTKLADSAVHTDPEAIFLFGGLALAGRYIFDPTIKHMEEHLMPVFRGKIKILPSGLEQQASPILGAASLIWDVQGNG